MYKQNINTHLILGVCRNMIHAFKTYNPDGYVRQRDIIPAFEMIEKAASKKPQRINRRLIKHLCKNYSNINKNS